MAFWLVFCLIMRPLVQASNASSSALSLLRDLLLEPLGRRLPLPRVPWFCG